MITRVTESTQLASAYRNIQRANSELARLQEQGSSQQRFARPSEDPVAAGDSMRLRKEIAAQTQYGRNIDDGNAWLTSADSALTTALDLLHRVRDLAVQGSSGTNSSLSREALADEVEELRDELLTTANTQYLGRSVFAGTSDAGVAFTDDLTFTGTPGATVERRVGPDSTVQVDADGQAAFGSGADSVFAALDRLATDLRSGAEVGSHINAISDHMSNVTGVLSAVGSRQARLDRQADANLADLTDLEGRRSEVEDVDLAKVLIQLQGQELAYQAALSVTSSSLQTSLLDYLR